MSGEYKASFIFPNGIVTYDNDQIEVAVGRGKTMSADEFAAAAIISEVLTRLRGGKFVSYDFNAKSFEDEARLVKCEWLKSGNLKIHGPTEKQHDHADTVEEAMHKHRTFTCSVSVSRLIPKKRVVKIMAAPADSSSDNQEGEVSSGHS